MINLRKTIDYSLSENKALEALTKIPARLLHVYDSVGSLDAGKLANFLITSGPIFNEKTTILQNWIQGEKYPVKEDAWKNIAGSYHLTIMSGSGKTDYLLDVKSNNAATVLPGTESLPTTFSSDGKMVNISF